MDVRNSALVVVLYFAGAVIVVGLGAGYYVWQRPGATLLAERTVEHVGGREATHFKPGAVTGRYAAPVAKSGQSLHELQAALNATRDKLDKTTRALNHKNSECKTLRGELDDSFMLLLDLLQDEPPARRDTSDAGKQARARLEAELEHLKRSLGRSELLDTERERQLDQLQVELIQADLELALIQHEAKQELDALAAEKRVIEDTSVAAIASCGAVAMPRLINLLSDERVEVRRWSAKALGAIGSEAQDALSFLAEMLTDPDEIVRANVQNALVAITEPAAR